MKSKQAAHYFHGQEGYNCAQAVLKAYQANSGMSELTIRSATVAGGGRAKNGICGALYAAQIILGEGTETDSVSKEFLKRNGSIKCSALKKSECGCRKLVSLSAQLLEEHIHVIDSDNPDYQSKRQHREVEMLPQPTTSQSLMNVLSSIKPSGK